MGMSRPSKAHTGAAKHLLRYLAGSTYFSITYKQGGFKLAAFLDANRGTTQTGKSTTFHRDARQRRQGLIALSTTKAELVAAAH